jgi:hypothetical protein
VPASSIDTSSEDDNPHRRRRRRARTVEATVHRWRPWLSAAAIIFLVTVFVIMERRNWQISWKPDRDSWLWMIIPSSGPTKPSGGGLIPTVPR